MNDIPIYTHSNWLLIRYLWPNGTWSGNKYLVLLDIDEAVRTTKLRKLYRVSPAIATCITASASECVSFTINYKV